MFSDADVLKLVKQAIDTAFLKFKAGHYQDAEVILAQTLKVSPANTQALQLLGLVKHNTGQFADAIGLFKRSLELEPDNPENYNNLGLCYSGIGQFDEAISSLQRAIELEPNTACFYSNLGLQYRHKDDLELATQSFQKSLAIAETETTWGMLGGCYGEKLELDKAEECFKKAIAIRPSFAGAHIDLANVYHLKGRWKEAWKEYEWRHEVFEQLKVWQHLYDQDKLWRGEPLNNKKIIVYGEQGHGDTIHFYRYAKLMSDLRIDVTVHCAKELAPLFESRTKLFVGDPLAISREDLPEHDYHCSLMSLPYLLENVAIPTEPYLQWPSKIVLDTYSDFFKIGIVWAGNPQHPNDARRSCRLANFRGIYDIPNIKLFSLVKDVRPRMYRFKSAPVDLAEGSDDLKIVDMAPLMETFADTAAIINSLDLVISVDTAVLHLAGAMGKPAYGLLPWNCDWRWSLTGDTPVWYPSVRLFRQKRPGDWASVFSAVERKLK